MYITKEMLRHGGAKLFRSASAWGNKSQSMNRVKYGVGLAENWSKPLGKLAKIIKQDKTGKV